MSDIHKTASNLHPSHAIIHSVPTSTFYTTKASQSIPGAYVPSHHTVEVKNKVSVQCNPSTSVDSASLNGGRVEFRVERGSLDVLTHAVLKIALTNSTGGNVTLAPTQLLIDRIELYSQNGNKLLTTMYGQELWLSNVFHDKFEWDYIAPSLGTSDFYDLTISPIANGVSKVYEVPILQVFSTAHLAMSALRNELLIRVYFNTSSLALIAGSLPTVDNMSIILKGYNEPSVVKQQRVDLYNSKRFIIPIKLFQRMNQNLTLAASSNYTIVLSGISGLISGLFVTVRALPFTALNQADYLKYLDAFDIQEANGTSMTGSYKRSNIDFNQEYAESFKNSMGLYSGFYFLNFSEDIVGDFKSGNTLGFHVMNGFQKLSFNTLSTITPGNYTIDIRALTAEHLMIQSGVLTVSSS